LAAAISSGESVAGIQAHSHRSQTDAHFDLELAADGCTHYRGQQGIMGCPQDIGEGSFKLRRMRGLPGARG